VGGGTPCFHNNMEFMLSAGKVFYLNTPIETLQLRLTEDTQRPFFSGLSEQEIKAKLISLFEEREKIYLKAYKKINTAHKSDKAIMEEISHEINM
jgi:shikimate kinase